MAKASISIKTPTPHSSDHNSRKVAPNYLILWLDGDEKSHNEFIQFPKYGYQNRDDIFEIARTKYKEKFKQSMQKKQIDAFWKEAIVNIKKEHTNADIIKLFAKYEEKLSIKKSFTYKKGKKKGQTITKQRNCFFYINEIAVHKDEGVFIKTTKHDVENIYYDHDIKLWFDLETGNNITYEIETFRPDREVFYNPDTKKWYLDRKFTKDFDSDSMQIYYNFHAHVTFTQFDFERCKSARIDAPDIVKMQDIAALELEMERGKTTRYTEKQIKEIQEQLQPIEKYQNSREYGKEFNRVARELGYIKPKKSINKHHTQLKDEAQEQEHNFREIQKKIAVLENANAEESYRLKNQVKNDKATIEKLNAKIANLKLKQENLFDQKTKAEFAKIQAEIQLYKQEQKIAEFKEQKQETIKPELEELREKVQELKATIEKLGIEVETPEESDKAEDKELSERDEIKALTRKIDSFNLAQKHILQIKEENTHFKTTLSKLQNQNKGLVEELHKKDKIINSKSNENDLTTQINDEMKEIFQIENIKQGRYSIRAIVTYLKEKFFKLKNLIQKLTSENEELKTENEMLRQKESKQEKKQYTKKDTQVKVTELGTIEPEVRGSLLLEIPLEDKVIAKECTNEEEQIKAKQRLRELVKLGYAKEVGDKFFVNQEYKDEVGDNLETPTESLKDKSSKSSDTEDTEDFTITTKARRY